MPTPPQHQPPPKTQPMPATSSSQFVFSKKADYFINARMSGERAWPPADLLLARRPQVTPGPRSSTSRPPNPTRFGSSRSITSYHQSQQSTQASLTECLSHTPTPTTTSKEDGTGPVRMPPRVATAIRPAFNAMIAVRLAAQRNSKECMRLHLMQSNCNGCSTRPACHLPNPSSQRAQHPQRRQRAQRTRQRPA